MTQHFSGQFFKQTHLVHGFPYAARRYAARRYAARLHELVHLLRASWHEWWSKPASAHLPSGWSQQKGDQKWLGYDDLPNLERKGC